MDSLHAREFILPVSKGYFPPLEFAKLKYQVCPKTPDILPFVM